MLDSVGNETVLIEKAMAGDPDAFGELYQIYLPPLYRYIYLRVGNVSDAEDLTEQVFLKAWEAMPGYRHHGHRFASWLYRIAHNTVVDYHRRRRHIVPLSKLSNERWWDKQRGLPEQVIEAEEVAELSSALAQLPEEQQRVIKLRFAEGLNHEEVGRIINKSAGASRMIQLRALTTLGQVLNKNITKTAGVAITTILLLLISIKLLISLIQSLPGDMGYPVKRTVETIQVAAAQTEMEKGQLHLRLAARRLEEAVQLQEQNRLTDMQQALTAYRQQLESLLPYFGEQSSLTRDEQSELVNALIATQANEEAQIAQLLAQAAAPLRPAVASALSTSQTVRQDAWQAVYGNQAGTPEGATPEPPAQIPQQPTSAQSPVITPTPTYVLQATPTPDSPPALPAQATATTTRLNAPSTANAPAPAAPVSQPSETIAQPTATPTYAFVSPTDTATLLPLPTSTPVPPPTAVPTVAVPTVEIPTVVVPTIVVPTVAVPTVEIPTVVVPTVIVPDGLPDTDSLDSDEAGSDEAGSDEAGSDTLDVEIPAIEVPSIEIPVIPTLPSQSP